jgi:site-specific recombinase XerD
LHKLSVTAVNRAAIATQSNSIAKDRGPVAANRARSTLSAMFAWAIGEGLCDENPVIGTNKQEEKAPASASCQITKLPRYGLAHRKMTSDGLCACSCLPGGRK